MKRPILVLLLLLAVAVGAAMLFLGQRDRGGGAGQSESPSGPSAEMMNAMHRMHESTNRIPMTGDIDRDFVALMVPHHQSAVEMARVYLQSGRDPELRKMSEAIIASQEAEIRQMLRGKPAPSAAAPHAGH
jgi:uncharacterized protein (DUF305 family)